MIGHLDPARPCIGKFSLLHLSYYICTTIDLDLIYIHDNC